MRIGVIGAGAVGLRVAQHFLASDDVEQVVVRDIRPSLEQSVVEQLGTKATRDVRRSVLRDVDLVVLATPPGPHVRLATGALENGVSVVSVSDSVNDVKRLLALDSLALSNDASLVVGAGFSPGLTGVLARHGAGRLERVDEIHTAKMGTGGPACARQHHRALKSSGSDRRDGHWLRRQGGSGRELVWFPAPVDAHDCYRGALPDTMLLVQAFPNAKRVTARVSATRRDRLTMHLPMLRRPHPEGLVGAVRVEVRGTLPEGGLGSVIMGAAAAPALGAAAVAACSGTWVLKGRMRSGAFGLSTVENTSQFLLDMADKGVPAEIFEGLRTLAADDLDELGTLVGGVT
ncbi:MAG: Gfo/Idh/MocA family oxidoreductase [Acidimicrobiales bacterium]